MTADTITDVATVDVADVDVCKDLLHAVKDNSLLGVFKILNAAAKDAAKRVALARPEGIPAALIAADASNPMAVNTILNKVVCVDEWHKAVRDMLGVSAESTASTTDISAKLQQSILSYGIGIEDTAKQRDLEGSRYSSPFFLTPG